MTTRRIAVLCLALANPGLAVPFGIFAEADAAISGNVVEAVPGTGIAAGYGVSWAMGLEGTMRGVTILQSAMPVAVFNYLWALRYDNSPEEVAAMAFFVFRFSAMVGPCPQICGKVRMRKAESG